MPPIYTTGLPNIELWVLTTTIIIIIIIIIIIVIIIIINIFY